MMADARVGVLLTEQQALATMPAPLCPVITLDTAWDDIAYESDQAPPSAATASSAAYVIYTSGSTGRPKGVVVEHRGLGSLAVQQAKGFRVDVLKRVLQFASTNFDAPVPRFWSRCSPAPRWCSRRRTPCCPARTSRGRC